MLAWMLAGAMACSLGSPASVYAAEENVAETEEIIKSGDFSYTVLEDGSAEITDYSNELASEVVIPDTIDGHKVMSIGEFAFAYSDNLTSIVIPDIVTEIGEFAFSFCSSLTNITLPDSLSTIGFGVFIDCSSLTSINIPDGVFNIDTSLFDGCSSLNTVHVDERNAWYTNYEGCLYSKDLEVLYFVPRNIKELTLPKGVTDINYNAFSDCRSLTNLIIPDSVLSIMSFAFQNCSSLTNIIIPDSVSTIGECAFEGCSSLELIQVDEGNNTYASYDGCLYSKDLKNLYSVPRGKKNINFSDGVSSIKYLAFSGCCNLISIVIPDSVTTIEPGAFSNCSSLSSVIIPNNVASIEMDTFSGCCNLANIVIPDSVSRIEEYAFCDCSSLSSIIIPNNVTSIEMDAFSGCSSLTQIIMKGDAPSASNLGLSELNPTIYVPENASGYDESPWIDYKIVYGESPLPFIDVSKSDWF